MDSAIGQLVKDLPDPPVDIRYTIMASVVEEEMLRRGFQVDPGHFGEHITWLFHVVSGAAHGFGWPRLVPGTSSMAGIFLPDFSLVASVAHLAFTVVDGRR